MGKSDGGRMTAEQRWQRRVERAQRHQRDTVRERSGDRDQGAVVLSLRPRARHTDVRGWAA